MTVVVMTVSGETRQGIGTAIVLTAGTQHGIAIGTLLTTEIVTGAFGTGDMT